jgi:hypothetical protein
MVIAGIEFAKKIKKATIQSETNWRCASEPRRDVAADYGRLSERRRRGRAGDVSIVPDPLFATTPKLGL